MPDTQNPKTPADDKAEGGSRPGLSERLAAVVPTTSGPAGEVTLDGAAGALAPWLAHRTLAEVADKIAAAIEAPSTPEVTTPPLTDPPPAPAAKGNGNLVLLVEDLSLLSGDWTARVLAARIGDLTAQLAELAHTFTGPRTPTVVRREVFGYSINLLAAAAEDPDAGGAEADDAADSGGQDSEDSEGGEAAADPAASAINGPLDGALNLISLLRTDYTVSGRAVQPGAAEARMLVAARLSKQVPVQIDSFRTLESNNLLDAFADLVRQRDRLTEVVAMLKGRVAPEEAALEDSKDRIARLDPLWSAALADKDSAAGAAEAVLTQITELENAAAESRGKSAGTRAAIDYLDRLLAGIDVEISAWISPPAAGAPAPLLVAASRYDLSGDSPGITHILYVSVDHLGADVVTRKTLLGESGRIGHLGAANATWVMLDLKENRILDGGNEWGARQMTYDLATGQNATSLVADGAELPEDTTLKTVRPWLIGAVVALVLLSIVATIFGVLGLVR